MRLWAWTQIMRALTHLWAVGWKHWAAADGSVYTEGVDRERLMQ
jgi:hypothetical protein